MADVVPYEEIPYKGQTETLYVWGIDRSLLQETVKEEFGKVAKVVRVTIIKDKVSGASKGFGYVECETPEEATKALEAMEGKVIGGTAVHIKYSYSDTPEWLKFLDSKGHLGDRPPRGRGEGRGRGGRGRGDRGGRGGVADRGGRGSRFVGRGRGEYREDNGRYGRYEADRRDGRGGPLPPSRRDPFAQPALYDDDRKKREEELYGMRRPTDEKIPSNDRILYGERVPYDDRRRLDETERMPIHRTEYPYDRHPPPSRDGIYEPPSGRYDDDKPPGKEPPDSYGSSRDEIIEYIRDRMHLYRTTDRKHLYDHRLEKPRTRSPHPPDRLHFPTAEYRARSPVDRPIIREREPYDRPSIRERDPYDRPSIRERDPYDRPSIREMDPYDRPSIRERDPYDRPSIREREPYDRPSIRERDPYDRPSIRERDPYGRPSIRERDPYEYQKRPVVNERDPSLCDPAYDAAFKVAQAAVINMASGYRPSHEPGTRPLSSYPERVPPPVRGPPERNPDMYDDPYTRVDRLYTRVNH